MTLYLGNNLISGVATPTEPTRNVGQIIESIVPLTDAGLHLLDGALINGSGIYSAFVDAIADLVTDYPDLFETEANWQSSVTTYGVCGKFVYDDVNNTVRLPKITGIIEGTTDLTALGDLVEAGLPNITGNFQYVQNVSNSYYASGAFYKGTQVSLPDANNGTTTGQQFGFDASRSSSIYGNSNTVQPQTIKCYYYIVIATTTKTEIEVDIDQVTTDLNGKADVDLTNVNNTATSKVSSWAMPSGTYIQLTAGASGTAYTAVADGYVQWSVRPTGAGVLIGLTNVTGNIASYLTCVNAGYLYDTYIPVKKGQTFGLYYSGALDVNNLFFTYASGSEWEA